MSQLSLIPQTIVTWYPSKKTASRPRIAQASDGLDYAVKHDEQGLPIRANEWVCAAIAQSIGIPVPHCIIVADGSGKLLFASQIYGDDINDNLPIFMASAPNQEIITQISRIHTYDLFVHNTDRHINNYLIRKQNNKDRIFAFDHGYSLFRYWPNIGLPMSQTINTARNIKAIKKRWGFDIPAALGVLDKLDKVPLNAVETTIRGLPQSWLPNKIRDGFLNWWDTSRSNRTQEIRDGIKNGTLL